MRNLSLAAELVTELPGLSLSRTAIDLDENVLYAVSEQQNSDNQLEVKIWKIVQADEATADPPTIFTMFTSNPSGAAAPEVVSLRFLPDSRQLAVLMRAGDITMVNLDDEDLAPQVEGTIDSGILAASWSPDDSLLAIVTGEQKLTLMTSTFDVLSDSPLFTTEFGEDAPINVGWGSKQTQFHGSLGKAAAQAPTLRAVGASPDDDMLPRVSWRGDGAFFVVSSLSPASETTMRYRTLRVYDRQAVLQSTSEAVAGLEHAMAWRPSGNLIVGTQRFGFEGGGAGKEGRHDVVFFERNGLRHGEFGLRVADLSIKSGPREETRKWGYKIRELSWSSDSNVLGLWIERDEGDIFQLWTTGNYHWYLKHEIAAPTSSIGPGRFTSIEWHPEKALHIILTTQSKIIQRTYGWETHVSPTLPPNDSGTVAVLDGSKVLLTPFRVQNVPPPMSSHELASPAQEARPTRTPVHAGLSPLADTLALLWETGYLELWDLRTRLAPGRGKVVDPLRNLSHFFGEDGLRYRQVIMSRTGAVQVLGSKDGHDVVTVLRTKDEGVESSQTVEMPSPNGRLILTDEESLAWQAPGGQLFEVHSQALSVAKMSSFPEFCFHTQRVTVTTPDSSPLYLGLSSSGKLFVTARSKSSRVLASNATSFTIASGFVIFTTSNHEATFAPLGSLDRLLIPDHNGDLITVPTDWDKRRVERGSRIVLAVPSAMSLVLQMPRGNLETIHPRPLVMEVVRQDLDSREYRKAFLSCRKHRIDAKALVEHDPDAFFENLSLFVEQVHEVDHINLFLTNLGQGSQQNTENIAKICDAIRVELERKDLTKYVNSILTAYMVKTPPDPEAGLALLLRLRESDPHLVEDAVKYIIFLVDADRLFDTALGMYDFSLVLMIAQHAQKDPREYLPFLRELRSLDKYYQRFRIDDHLKRHDGALRNLQLAGPEHFDEAVAYIEQHRLYELAISIWRGTEQYSNILEVYGEWLFERREFRQAASVYTKAGKLTKAMAAHEKCLEWQELFDLAARTGVAEEDVTDIGYRVAEDLVAKKRYSEAARVLLDYAKDVREAVIALVQGNCFSEARRIVTLTDSRPLMEDILHPGALESRAQISEDIGEMRDQLRKQLVRVRELRAKKAEEPDAFYGMDEDKNLHNVDTMTDVSMPFTAFTRYTIAPSASSSKRTSRSKRKLERKAGRKGTADEEEYLLKSVAKLVGRYHATQGDARQLLPHLAQFTAEHVAEGTALQMELAEFEQELVEAVDEIWRKEEEDATQDTWAQRMAERERQRLVDPSEKIPKPTAKITVEWRLPNC